MSINPEIVKNSIVRVYQDEKAIGTGFRLGSQTVVTCAHVVNSAFGKDKKSAERPEGKITIDFPLSKDTNPYTAEVEIWHLDSGNDVALLSVVEKLPEPESYIQLLPTTQSFDRKVKIYGFSKENGKWANGKLSGPEAQGWIQLDNLDHPIDEGDSGAPVWDEEQGQIIGMAVATSKPNFAYKVPLAYIIPATTLVEIVYTKEQISELLSLESKAQEDKTTQARRQFEIKLKIDALSIEREITAVGYNREVENLQDRLKQEILMEGEIPDSVMAALPEVQLSQLLFQIEDSHAKLFWQSWQQSPASNLLTKEKIRVNQAYAYLSNSEQLHSFLSDLYQLLERFGDQEHSGKLAELTKAVCGNEPEWSEVVEEETGFTGRSTLLIKLKSTHSPEDSFVDYILNAWLIKDKQAYQKRFEDEENSDIDLSAYSKPLVKEASIKIDSDDLETQNEGIKREISKIVTELWDDRSFSLPEIEPEVVFCVPIQLLEIDFQNIELGDDSLLGWDLPVSVSCLERYESGFLNEYKYKQRWLSRWKVLEDFDKEFCSTHIKICDHSVDIACAKTVRQWLKFKDEKDKRKVAGIGFHLRHKSLTKAFQPLLGNGLPILLWPKEELSPDRVDDLKKALDVIPLEVMSAIKKHRIGAGNNTAGHVSILLDNPYLPPPDCEIDY